VGCAAIARGTACSLITGSSAQSASRREDPWLPASSFDSSRGLFPVPYSIGKGMGCGARAWNALITGSSAQSAERAPDERRAVSA